MTLPRTVVFEGGPIGESSSNHSSGRRQSMRDQSRRSSAMRDQSRSRGSLKDQSEHSKASGSRRRPHLMLEDPIDGPWQRIKDEWRHDDSWFGLDDCGRLLDVPNTFGGNQTVQKWLIFLWMMATLLYLWSTHGSAWFLGDLDHWALIFSMLYQTMSLGNAHFTPPQPGDSSEPVNLYLRFFWIIFEIAAHLQLLVTLVFWMVTFPSNDNLPITYGTFALHGFGLLAVWIDGMALNHVPVRIKHYFIVVIVDIIYCLWTIIHAGAGLDNGMSDTDDNNPDQSDAIYLALDWRNETVQAVFLMIAILAFLAPLCFLVQYCFSLFSFPCVWNGSKSRRCIEFDMSRSAMSRSQRKRFNPTPTLSKAGNTSETSRASSMLDLSMGMGGSRRRGGLDLSNGRSGVTSPTPASKRVSIRAAAPPTEPPARRASSVPASSRRASAAAPASPKPRRASTARPTSPTPRRASTSPKPRRASTARPTSPAPRRASTAKPTSPAPRRASTSPKPRRASTAARPTSPTPKRSTTPTPGKASSNVAKPTLKRASTAPKRSTTPTPSTPKSPSRRISISGPKKFPAQERRDSNNYNKMTLPSNNKRKSVKQPKKNDILDIA